MRSRTAGLTVFSTLLGVLLILTNSAAAATTLAQLQATDQLQIKVWVEPATGIVARQQLKLQIEVATTTSFSRGTRFGHFEIKDAIVMQRETSALNSVREQAGKTWTVQQWTLVIYPQRSGEFEIPPVPLTLSIRGEDKKPVIGQARTQPLTFSAMQPEALIDRQNWVATHRFEVVEQFDRPLDELKPGDALLRTIRISAEDLPAMMLPQVSTETVPGIAAYAKPAQLTDRINRGDYLAQRNQLITYVVEKTGEYQLPQQSFYWWNLATGAAEIVVLPAHNLIVSTLPGQAEKNPAATEAAFAADLHRMLSIIYRLAAIVALLLLLLWLTRKWLVSRSSAAAAAGPTQRWLLKQARLACRQHNDARALDYLYQWTSYYDRQPDTIGMQVEALHDRELKLAYHKVMRTVYRQAASQSSDTWAFIKQFTDVVKQQQKPRYPLDWRVELKLN